MTVRLGPLVAGLRALFHRRQVERELDEELRAYLEIAAARKMASGSSREQAIRAARVELGGIEAVKDRVRDAGWESIVDSVCQDVRYAIRGVRGSPGFATAAILTMAFGIGANTATFSVVHAVLLRPLPYVGANRLVRIFENNASGGRESPLAVSDLAAFRSHAITLSHAGVYLPAMVTMGGAEGRIRLGGVRLSATIFSMLDPPVLIGRAFNARDEGSDADAVIILSSAVWEGHFGRDPNILSRHVELDGKEYSVVGVMPTDFQFPEGRPEFWVPFAPPSSSPNRRQRLPLIARVKDGVSLSEAAAEVTAILTPLNGTSRNTAGAPTPPRFELVDLQDLLVGPVKPALLLLAVTVVFVLCIACANVANLLLARGAARRREIAIRIAIGAGRGRLIRQALTESIVLALAGAAAGTLLAYGGIRVLRTAVAAQPDLGPDVIVPRLGEIGLDTTVLSFTVAIAVLAGLLFGLAPAMRQSRPAPIDALHEGGSRWQGALVVAEIGMAVMLLVGGGLLIRSFVNLVNVRPGYDPRNLLTFKVSLPPGRSDTQLGAFGQDLAARLETLPRVRAVGYAETLPLVRIARLGWLGSTPEMPRDPDTASRLGTGGRTVSVRIVGRHFLNAMGTQVIAGRGFADTDGAGRPQVMLINQTLALSMSGTGTIGTELYVLGSVSFDPRRLGPNRQPPRPWQIVGIVEDVRQASLDREPGPEIYVDFRQLPGPSGPPGSARYFAVRSEDDPTSMASTIRGMVRQFDPQALLEDVAPMRQLVSSSIARPRLYTELMSLFAFVAMTLSAVGIFGVMAYTVAQRRHEIGVRMALGAQPGRVIVLVMRWSLAVTGLGMGLGLGASLLVTRYLQTMLFGLTPFDPKTFLGVAVLFSAVTALASFLPARRATTVDPLVALRTE